MLVVPTLLTSIAACSALQQFDANNMQVDIWALGISAIEMAETIPPRWTVHPMRVIFLISREDAPRLADWDKWSLNFHDFIRMCLLKVPTSLFLSVYPMCARVSVGGIIA